MISSRRRFVRALALAGCLPLLCACATKFDAASAARIKTIAIQKVDEPKYYAFNYFVAKQTPITPDASQDFNAAMERQNLHLGAELAASVAQALRSDGYQIANGDEADAVMTLTIGGFLPDQPGPTYSAHGAALEPEMTIKARLTDTKTKKTLFEQLYLIANNSIKPMDGTVMLVPDQKYYLTANKDLAEKADVAAAGFRSALPMVSGHIAQAFKRP